MGRGRCGNGEAVTPSEIMKALVPGAAANREAGRALLELLRRLSTLPLVEPKSREVYKVQSEEDREEIVARAALKTIQKAPLPVTEDAAIEAYLRSMLVRFLISLKRWEGKHQPVEEERLGTPDGSEQGDEESETREMRAQLALGRTLLDRAFADAAALRGARYRSALDKAWRQIESLVFEEGSMDAILACDEGLGPDATPELVKAARDRVLKAHQRCRDAVRASAERMIEDGEIGKNDAQLLRKMLTALFRRQTRGT